MQGHFCKHISLVIVHITPISIAYKRSSRIALWKNDKTAKERAGEGKGGGGSGKKDEDTGRDGGGLEQERQKCVRERRVMNYACSVYVI